MTKSAILYLIVKYATLMEVDPNLAISVAQVESNFNAKAKGAIGEIGIYQIRPEYSMFGKKALENPEINIIEGIRKLKEAKEKCNHKDAYVVCYNTGVAGAKKVKNPWSHRYVKKVYSNYMLASKYEYLLRKGRNSSSGHRGGSHK